MARASSPSGGLSLLPERWTLKRGTLTSRNPPPPWPPGSLVRRAGVDACTCAIALTEGLLTSRKNIFEAEPSSNSSVRETRHRSNSVVAAVCLVSVRAKPRSVRGNQSKPSCDRQELTCGNYNNRQALRQGSSGLNVRQSGQTCVPAVTTTDHSDRFEVLVGMKSLYIDLRKPVSASQGIGLFEVGREGWGVLRTVQHFISVFEMHTKNLDVRLQTTAADQRVSPQKTLIEIKGTPILKNTLPLHTLPTHV
ncbi:hypothetical protein RRG08_060168 [Elysia crispata]|uniref:Uncharacterized protein n=1 Tax=Elysia crispata TaxID=231223 RepID=A0AAE1A112_9GAST|nr:hypothetical protein RRG08_060168 [Elysia crispata]